MNRTLSTLVSVTSGGMQWLVSGTGALHEEVIGSDEDGIFHMAQLWINVPAAMKMDPPEHHAAPAESVPELVKDGVTTRLFAATTVPVPEGWTAAFTVVAGHVSITERDALSPGDTAVFADDGESMTVRSTDGGQILLMGGGFMMHTHDEIEAAFADYRAGAMGSLTRSR